MPSSIDSIQKEIIDEFQLFDDWNDKYQYLIDLGKQLPLFPEKWSIDANKIEGCQSQVWFHCERMVDTLQLHAISDSIIVSGLIALVLRIYSGQPAGTILSSQPYFIDAIGLNRHLSQNRSNGLSAMLGAIQSFALASESASKTL